MDNQNQANQQATKQKSVNKDKSKKPPAEILPWQNQEIFIVDNLNKCRVLVKKLRAHCTSYNVLGIECDSVNYNRRKIAVLLLSTHDGLCAVIRLSVLTRIPPELKEILEDEKILKVTVSPIEVAMELTIYGVFVASVFDLQYLAAECDSKAWTLENLSIEYLKVKLKENYRMEQMRWKRNRLAEGDVNYAAKKVRVSIELFKMFQEKLKGSSTDNDVQKFIDEHCKAHLNKYYRKEHVAKTKAEATVVEVQNERALPKPTISIIATVEAWQTALLQIREHISKYKVLGFCCKLNSTRSTATLLQLATQHGFCAFIQLSKFKTIPDELKELLEDGTILKVGGRVFADASRLELDYGINVANTLDLRHLAKECNYRPNALDRLSKEHLNVDLSVNDWRWLVTDWKSDKFSDDALDYATKTVQVTIELFKVFEEKLLNEKCSGDRTKFIDEICQQYFNEDFPKKKAENNKQDGTGTLPEQNIQIVNNVEECKTVIEQLKSQCSEYNVLGFDCEWVPLGRRKVAMLQLATNNGLCALIRLCKLENMPNELRDILKDKTILKVGISPPQDVKKLAQDYRLEVKGALDLVRLAKKCGFKGTGLASLAQEVLNVNLPLKKRGLIVDKLHKNWENDTLDDKNIKYAANDVHASIELFKKFEEKLMTKEDGSNSNDNQTKKLQDFISQFCTPFIK